MKQKIPFKHFLLLSILLAASIPSHAQHFDWVKTYYGLPYNTDDRNKMISSVTDREGNIYVLGYFTPNARIDSTDVLPFAVTDNVTDNIKKGALIAKVHSFGRKQSDIFGQQVKRICHVNVK